MSWAPDDLAAGADLEPPPDHLSEESPSDRDGCAVGCGVAVVGIAIVLLLVGLVVKRRRR